MRGGSPRGTPYHCILLQPKFTTSFQQTARSRLSQEASQMAVQGGALSMRTEHVKAWLRGIVEEEDPKGQGNEGKGAN